VPSGRVVQSSARHGGRPRRTGNASDAAARRRRWRQWPAGFRGGDDGAQGRVSVRRGVQSAAGQAAVAATVVVFVGRWPDIDRPEEELGQWRVSHQVTVQVGPFFRVRQDFGSGTRSSRGGRELGARNRFPGEPPPPPNSTLHGRYFGRVKPFPEQPHLTIIGPSINHHRCKWTIDQNITVFFLTETSVFPFATIYFR